MKNKFRKYLGEILLLVGAFIFIVGLLSFENRCNGGYLGSGCDGPVRYFYNVEVKVIVGVGLMMLIGGILVVRRKNEIKE